MSIAIPNVRVCNPSCHEGLSVFPLFAETGRGVEYILADEALGNESAVVEEISEAGSVPELLVHNKSDTKVLFIEGEELIGAKQNRILNTSILVAAHSKLKIPVSCVEQSRWFYRKRSFASSGSHSPHELRYELKKSVFASLESGRGHRSDQSKVWEKVGRIHAAHGTSSPTGAMSDAFEALDIFDRPSTCKKVWDRLLSGFMMDALEEGVSKGRGTGADDVNRLLGRVSDAKLKKVDPVGEGEEFRAEFDENNGSILAVEGTMIHGSVLTAV